MRKTLITGIVSLLAAGLLAEGSPEKLAWWTRSRFGMFIHFGLYATPARGEWVKQTETIAEQDYRRHFEEFNPDLYDPATWAKIAKAAGFAVRGDFGLNIYNSRSMQYLRAQGVDSQLLSFELTLPQIRDISKAVPSEVLVYGRLPLMLMENCVIKNRTGTCACDAGVTKLVDRMGEEFPIVKDGGSCRNVLLNGKKLYLLDKLAAFRGMGLWALRLSFTTENAGEVDKVLADWARGGTFEPGSYTRGLYQRGVE